MRLRRVRVRHAASWGATVAFIILGSETELRPALVAGCCCSTRRNGGANMYSIKDAKAGYHSRAITSIAEVGPPSNATLARLAGRAASLCQLLTGSLHGSFRAQHKTKLGGLG